MRYLIGFLLIIMCPVLIAQNGFIRGLIKDTQTEKWQFYSMNMDTEVTTILQFLPDTIEPLSGGSWFAFNENTQQYFYLGENPETSTRYLVTLDAYNGNFVKAVEAAGVYFIYAHDLNGSLYGYRSLTVNEVVKINPNSGEIVGLADPSNFGFGYTPAASDIYEPADDYYIVGKSFTQQDRIFVMDLITGQKTDDLTHANMVFIRTHLNTEKVLGIQKVLDPVGYKLVEIDPEDPHELIVLNEDIQVNLVDGPNAYLNSGLNLLYFRGKVNQDDPLSLIVMEIPSGEIIKSVILDGELSYAASSYPPAEVVSKISGIAFLDENTNGTHDDGEIGMMNQAIDIEPGGFTVLTGTDGTFSLNVLPETYNVTLFPTSQFFITSSPSSYDIEIENPGQHIEDVDFGLAIVAGASADSVEVSITPSRAVVGKKSNHTITISNKGGTVLSGKVKYKPGKHMTVATTSVPPDEINDDEYVWEYEDLKPGETRQINVVVDVPADPDLIGEMNYSSAIIEASSPGGEEFTEEQTACQEIHGSYDPNDKAVNPGANDSTALPGQRLDYRIRFQNVGNDTAYDIRIEDQLSEWLDRSTFNMKAASHNYNLHIDENNKVTWFFPNILLPDSNVNQLGSNGFIEFSIWLKDDIPDMTLVSNSADIFFDFNPPVATNNADIKIRIPSSVAEREANNMFTMVSPNPSNGNIVLSWEEPARETDIYIYKLSGELIRQESTGFGNKITLNLDLQTGTYLYQIITGNGMAGKGKFIIR